MTDRTGWLSEIHTRVAQVVRDAGLDRRLHHIEVRLSPPDARIVVETSSVEVTATLRAALVNIPTGVDFVTLPRAEDVDRHAVMIAGSSVADIRRAPSHAAELVSQIVYGDPVERLKSGGDWELVRLDDGYVGWIRSWHVVSQPCVDFERFRAGARHRIRDNLVQVFDSPQERATPVTDAVVGTPVRATPVGRRGWRQVSLPDGRSGFLRARSLEPVPGNARPRRDRLAATGMRFLGIPYLWGGTTPKGFDCSGLMQRIYRLHGITLPRDSDQQSRFGSGRAVGRPERLRTGDLVFFGKADDQISHVGLYLSDGLFLHAYGQVRVASFDPTHPLYDARLAEIWRVSRDPLD